MHKTFQLFVNHYFSSIYIFGRPLKVFNYLGINIKSKNNMKKIVLGIILMLILFFGNILVYLAHTQFKCTDKIKNNQDLNIYEIFSALQCHACFWMFGWVVDPNTAQLCFLKQFYLNDNYKFFNFDIPEDERLKKFKEEAKRTGRPVRMSWPKYTSRASILLNGSYVDYLSDPDEYGNVLHCYNYRVINDYKPGIINIHGITISETVFDYLENKGYLLVDEYRFLSK